MLLGGGRRAATAEKAGTAGKGSSSIFYDKAALLGSSAPWFDAASYLEHGITLLVCFARYSAIMGVPEGADSLVHHDINSSASWLFYSLCDVQQTGNIEAGLIG